MSDKKQASPPSIPDLVHIVYEDGAFLALYTKPEDAVTITSKRSEHFKKLGKHPSYEIVPYVRVKPI